MKQTTLKAGDQPIIEEQTNQDKLEQNYSAFELMVS